MNSSISHGGRPRSPGGFRALVLAVLALGAAQVASAACEPSNPIAYGFIGELYYQRLGGPAGTLGNVLTCEADAPHGGRYSRFRRGVIYWHPQIGAHVIYAGATLDLWNRLGAAAFGYPTTDESPTADRAGRYTIFRSVHLPGKPEASIYFSPRTGAHPVYGAFWQQYKAMNWELSSLGYPSGDERDDAGFRRQDFEGGYLRWSASTGVSVVQYVGGAIADRYRTLGGPGGALGPPLGPEQAAPYGGRFNAFRAGWIYYHPETGAHAVYGLIGAHWNQLGRVAFGYPTNDETPTAGRTGLYNQFRAVHLPGKPEAAIYYSQQTGAHAVYGAIYQKWREMGWERSPLGYPVKDEYDDAGFRRVDFEHGTLRWSAATGVAVMQVVYGAIGEKYAALGGAAGVLGRSLGVEQAAPHGGRFNLFQKGMIYYHPETGAHAIYGKIGERWLQLGGPAFGYPTNDEASAGQYGFRFNDFKAVHLPGKPVASIYYSNNFGAKAIHGAIRDKWLAVGGVDSSYSAPKREEYDDHGFRRVDFQNGFIRWSASLGAQAISVDTTPGRCTAAFRKWNRTGDDSFGLVEPCIELMGINRYCTDRHAFVATFYTRDTSRPYLSCVTIQDKSTPLEDIEHIVVGVGQGLATAFVAAAPFIPTVVEGASCVTGVVFACGILAVDIAAKIDAPLPEIAREALELASDASGCIDFNPVACAKLGHKGLQAAGYTIPGFDPAAIAAEVQKCYNGDFAACANLGREAAEAAGVPPGLGLSDVVSGLDCINGDLETCKQLGIEAAQANLPLGGITNGVALATACRNGNVTACQQLGRALMGSSAPALPSASVPPVLPYVIGLPEVSRQAAPATKAPQATQRARRVPLPPPAPASVPVEDRLRRLPVNP